MSSRIVFIESNMVGAGYSGEAAIALGYSPFFLLSQPECQADVRLQARRFDNLECETTSVEAMVAAVKTAGLDDIYAVVSLLDTGLISSIRLAQALGVKSFHPVVERLKDKGEAYELIPEFSPPSVIFSSDRIPLDEIAKLFESSRAVIIKGRKASGGLGSFVLRSPAEIGRVEGEIANSNLKGQVGDEDWMAQAFVDGQLVSVEGYVLDSKPRFLGFSGRKKIGTTECSIMFPWDSHVHLIEAEAGKTAVRALVKRAEFTHGYFHIEMILKDGVARMIDANIGRIGGGGLGQQIALSYGITPTELHKHILSVGIDGRELEYDPFTRPPLPSRSVMYGIPVDAELHEVILPDDFACLHTKVTDPWQVIPHMGRDNYAWIGIVTGLYDTAVTETAKIKIRTSEGVFDAVF